MRRARGGADELLPRAAVTLGNAAAAKVRLIV
jgi:hypothetical protein